MSLIIALWSGASITERSLCTLNQLYLKADFNNCSRGVHATTMTSNWEQLAADKRKRIVDSIPSDWVIRDLPSDDNVFAYPKASGLLSAQEIELTESSATDLVAQLAQGKLKSVDVTLAFCKRAAIAQQLVSWFVIDTESTTNDGL
jgi:hypothetical protein